MNNKEFKDAWVKALRSGEYEQCRGSLARDAQGNTPQGQSTKERLAKASSFCCLGVGQSLLDDDYTVFGCCQRMDIDSNALVNLNDVQEANFNEIADYIEENAKI